MILRGEGRKGVDCEAKRVCGREVGGGVSVGSAAVGLAGSERDAVGVELWLPRVGGEEDKKLASETV